jgi:hypothetical protein
VRESVALAAVERVKAVIDLPRSSASGSTRVRVNFRKLVGHRAIAIRLEETDAAALVLCAAALLAAAALTLEQRLQRQLVDEGDPPGTDSSSPSE